MTKKFNSIYLILGLLGFTYMFSSWAANPPNGKTGAPGDSLCTDCHNSNIGSFVGDLSVDGIPTTILPNTNYSVTVTSSYTGSNAPSRTGFQIVALDANDQTTGTISNVGTDAVKTVHNNRDYVEHNPAKFFGSNNAVTWTFDWQSPNGNTGDMVNFYYSGIFGNGSGSSGDNMVNSTLQTTIGTAVVKPVADAGGQANLVCGFPNVVLNGQFSSMGANYTYLWTGPGVVSGATTLFPTVNVAGTYTLTVTDTSNGCTSMDSTIVVDDTTPPTVDAGNSQTLSCNNPSVTLMASSSDPNASFLWEFPDGSAVGGATVIASDPGIYTVTASTNNGCEAMAVVEVVSDNTQPLISIAESSILNCNSPNIVVLNASATVGATDFQWSGPNLMSITDMSINVTVPGTYNLVVTSSNGCTSSESIVVELETHSLDISNLTASLLCFGDSPIFTGVTGTDGPFSFDWSMNSPADVTITDSAGCFEATTVNITVPPALVLTANITDESPAGGDGVIDLMVSGGTPPYNLNSTVFSDLSAGDYPFTVTDANGCQQTQTFTVGMITGVNNPLLSQQIALFPNPSNGLLSLQIDLPQQENIDLKVYNFAGQLVRVENTIPVLNQAYTLDLQDLGEGIYFVKINIGAEIITKKILIQRD